MLKLQSTCSEEKFNFFFSDFSQTLPGFLATVFEKECQNRILCYQWYLLQEKTKNFNFKTSHWVSRTIFRKSWQNHFPFVQGHFLETKCFLQKTYTMKFPNFSSKKLPNLGNKIPQCWRNCFWWARRNHVEEINFSKVNCLLTNLLPTSGWNFTAVFPWLLSASSRIHFG